MDGKIVGSLLVNVYYEDTDALGFVYHPNYLKYFERAREHLIGFDLLKQISAEGILFVVRRIEMVFHAPSYHCDQLTILSELSYSRSPRLRAWQRVMRDSHCLVEGQLELAAINRQGKPVRLPESVLARLQAVAPE